jgi:hypothetical protein
LGLAENSLRLRRGLPPFRTWLFFDGHEIILLVAEILCGPVHKIME